MSGMLRPENYVLSLDMNRYTNGLKSTFRILGMKHGDRVLIATSFVPDGVEVDETELRCRRETYTMAKFLGLEGTFLGYEVVHVEYPATMQNGKEPPADVAELMLHEAREGTPMIFMPWDSLTHTRVRKEACMLGARIMSSPHFTADMMENGGPMCADYSGTKRLSEGVARMIDCAEWDRIASPDGTDIMVHFVDVKDARAIVDPRDLSVLSDDPLERYGNYPAGEAFRAIEPHPETCGVIAGYLNGELVRLEVEGGIAARVLSRNTASEKLQRALFEDEIPEGMLVKRRSVAEDGTGTNMQLAREPQRWTYSTLTAEKIGGTKHIAVGNNSGFGGSNDCDLHQDLIIFKPTATLIQSDGKSVTYLRDGEFTN